MKRSLSACLMLVALGACTRRFTLYPVEGPLSHETPVVVMTGVADGLSRGTGTLRAVLPDAGTCEGQWAASARSESVSTISGGLIGTYGSTYFAGTGVTVDGRGIRCAGVLICSDGRVVDMDFVAAPGAHGFGIARDNRGNVYRLIF